MGGKYILYLLGVDCVVFEVGSDNNVGKSVHKIIFW